MQDHECNHARTKTALSDKAFPAPGPNFKPVIMRRFLVSFMLLVVWIDSACGFSVESLVSHVGKCRGKSHITAGTSGLDRTRLLKIKDTQASKNKLNVMMMSTSNRRDVIHSVMSVLLLFSFGPMAGAENATLVRKPNQEYL